MEQIKRHFRVEEEKGKISPKDHFHEIPKKFLDTQKQNTVYILDVDGTLMPFGKNKITNNHILQQIENLKKNGRVVLTSNNLFKNERVVNLAESLNVQYIKITNPFYLKPSRYLLEYIKSQDKNENINMHVIGDWWAQEGLLAKLGGASFTWVKPYITNRQSKIINSINKTDINIYNFFHKVNNLKRGVMKYLFRK